MRKLFYLGLIALLGVIIGFAWAEQITLTTYYPAPYGVYREFTTTGNTYLARDSGNVGIGTTSPQVHPSNPSGNLDVNDVYLRSTNSWLSATAGGGGFGVWNDRDKDGVADTVTQNTTYQAATDGIVTAYTSLVTHGDWLRASTDGNNPPTTITVYERNGWGTNTRLSITTPVRKNDYWRVEIGAGTATVNWMPSGS